MRKKARPSGFGAFQLVVPIVRAGEKAMDNADDADASSARFNAPLVRDGRRARDPAIGLGSPLLRRFPGRHGRSGLHARAEVQLHRDRLPVALLELNRHKPGRNSRPGRDGLPDFFRRAGNLDFDLDGTAAGGFFLHAHDGSLGSRFLRQRVRHDYQAMRAAAGGGFIVILRNEFRDGLDEFVTESRPVRRRPKANLGVHRQGRQAFPRLFRTTNEVAHLADDACAHGDEIARGQPIDFPIRINGDWAQGARRDNVGSGRRHEQPFRQPAPLAFLGQPHQPVRLQRVQVVVDLLPSQANPRGQRRRRRGHGQLGEESTPHGLQGHRRRRRIIDDLDVEHEERVALTTIVVKRESRFFLPNSRSRWRAAEL